MDRELSASSVEPLLATPLRHDRDALMREAVRANVRASANQLRHGSEVVEDFIERNGLRVVGAEYSLETGVVRVLRGGLTVFLRWLLASFHLLALGIGLGAIYVRARSLQAAANPAWVRRVLRADTWWGVAALLWLATGLPRLFLGHGKPTTYYVHNHVFWLKMALFLLIFLLELGPMMTFTGWRRAFAAVPLRTPALPLAGPW